MNGDPENDAFINEWWTWLKSSLGIKSFEQVSQEHLAFSQELFGIVNAGINEHDTKYGGVWPNTCEWIKEKGFPLVTLVRTHDSAKRAKKMGKAGKYAMFSTGERVPNQGTFNKDNLEDERNISFLSPGTGGWRREDGLIALTEVSRAGGIEGIREVLVHEVQHDADQHLMFPLDRYISELRAYWVDGGQFSQYSVESGSAKKGIFAGKHSLDGFDNERQQKIFLHLFRNSASYGYMAQVWEAKASRDEVIKTGKPTGINMINSVRLPPLWEAVYEVDRICGKEKDLAARGDKGIGVGMGGESGVAAVAVLDAAIAQLTVLDRTALLADDMRPVWAERIGWLKDTNKPVYDRVAKDLKFI